MSIPRLSEPSGDLLESSNLQFADAKAEIYIRGSDIHVFDYPIRLYCFADMALLELASLPPLGTDRHAGVSMGEGTSSSRNCR